MGSQMVCLTLTLEENSRVRRHVLEMWRFQFQLCFFYSSVLRARSLEIKYATFSFKVITNTSILHLDSYCPSRILKQLSSNIQNLAYFSYTVSKFLPFSVFSLTKSVISSKHKFLIHLILRQTFICVLSVMSWIQI